jgi:hypothetical protein
MLEQKLQEELNRYKAINKYGKTMIMEQDAPPADPALDAVAPPADPALDAVAPPVDPAAPIDPAAAPADVPAETDTTEEIDITDLVNMTKSLKKDVEDSKNENGDVIGKMDDVFTKLSDLESKLSQMDQVMAKIDELNRQNQKRELRNLKCVHWIHIHLTKNHKNFSLINKVKCKRVVKMNMY